MMSKITTNQDNMKEKDINILNIKSKIDIMKDHKEEEIVTPHQITLQKNCIITGLKKIKYIIENKKKKITHNKE